MSIERHVHEAGDLDSYRNRVHQLESQIVPSAPPSVDMPDDNVSTHTLVASAQQDCDVSSSGRGTLWALHVGLNAERSQK